MITMNLPLDKKEAAGINRRRMLEEQRKLRIFDPRRRLIGVDVQALDQQVHANCLSKAEERDKDKAFVQQVIRCDQMAVMLEKQQAEEIRQIKQQIDHFRLTEQKPEYRREFDIYDPDGKKKDLPARVSDDDPRCSISGLQRLVGEDLNYKERTKKQRAQFSDWMKQQMLENRMKSDKERNEQWQLENKLLQLDRHAVHLDNSEAQTRRSIATSVKDTNVNLAKEQKQYQNQQKISEEIEKMQEIRNNFYGDFLTENPSCARSSYGPHRVVPDRWKGMSKEQLENYRQGQREQIVENKYRKEQADQEEAKWDQLRLSQTRQAILLERDQNRQIRQLNKNQLQRNHELSQEQKMHDDYLNKVVYENVPTDDYFAQFNTTTR